MQARFAALDERLSALLPLWDFQPFTHLRLPWEAQHPALVRWLRSLNATAIEHLEQNPQRLSTALGAFLPEITQVHALGAMGALPIMHGDTPLHRAIAHRVPGRKWQQICAFAKCLPTAKGAYLEWCAGKGHLGRLLAYRDAQAVHSLELRKDLCQAGQALVTRVGVAQRLYPLDVLRDAVREHLLPDRHGVALHACGELHLQLLREGSRAGLQRLSISPCCYNLIPQDDYQPLSTLAQQSPLRLTQRHLRLPLQETVTAGQRVQRLRHREVDWRLGLDLLQRELSGVDTYRNLPHFPKSLLNGTFADFCQMAADYWGLRLVPSLDYARYEAAGQARRLDVSRMELVRHVFRRPLEIWLVLDRALYLYEQGYQVSVGCFCKRELTPRNVLIQAQRN